MWIRSWIALIISVTTISAFGQNSTDSVIIDTSLVYYNPGVRTDTVVSAYFVVDDTCVGFWLPINWHSPDGQIFPDNLPPLWNYPFTEWETSDSIDLGNNMIRLQGNINDTTDPVLYSGGQRLLALRLRFVILPTAIVQVVTITEGNDPLMGGATFADPHGGPGIDPLFRSGYIRYGINAGIDDLNELQRPKRIGQNYPNPFNSETSIEYVIYSEYHVSISIYNVLGVKILDLLDETQQAGTYFIKWSAQGLSSGMYFARIQTGNEYQIIKMVLLK